MANQFTLKNGGYEPFIGNYGLVPQPPIPEPDAEDNGKVLGVSNGSYALVNGGGGGGSVIVPVIPESETLSLIAQIENKELYELYISGTTVLFEDDRTTRVSYVTVIAANYDTEYNEYVFVVAGENGTTAYFGEGDTGNPTYSPNPES